MSESRVDRIRAALTFLDTEGLVVPPDDLVLELDRYAEAGQIDEENLNKFLTMASTYMSVISRVSPSDDIGVSDAALSMMFVLFRCQAQMVAEMGERVDYEVIVESIGAAALATGVKYQGDAT